MVGLLLNVIGPLVCFSYMVMMVEIASQRVKASCVLSVFFLLELFSCLLVIFREDLFHHFLMVTPRDKSRFEVFIFVAIKIV